VGHEGIVPRLLQPELDDRFAADGDIRRLHPHQRVLLRATLEHPLEHATDHMERAGAVRARVDHVEPDELAGADIDRMGRYWSESFGITFT
jgi:hypothetical protein